MIKRMAMMTAYTDNSKHAINTIALKDMAGHADHWAMVGATGETLQSWLKASLDSATTPKGLGLNKTCDDYLLIGSNDSCHIKQVFNLANGKPSGINTIFPAVNSPYGLHCTIEQIICSDTQDAILMLKALDGTIIYAFDQLYAINRPLYQAGQSYYVNMSAWAYNISLSKQDEIVVIDDPKAIRYHHAFNDIVAQNNGIAPKDIEERIKNWQPKTNEELLPIEINMGKSCIYLFGETQGQQDEAWCQGQVLGKSSVQFFFQEVLLFDVVILRELNSQPLVLRIAVLANEQSHAIQVQDYIQANIWLQASIYGQNQEISQ